MREQLGGSKTVTDAIYDAGYGSSSRFYEADAQQLGMSPSDYRKHGAGMNLRFTIFDSRVGKVLIATTDRGVASIRFGDDPAQLEEGLRSEFRLATIERDDQNLLRLVQAIQEHLSGARHTLDIPLDVQATAFQRRVWEMLRTIPYGETRSYAAIAKELGNSKATRAVARACATNPVALAIPCHRVVASNGALAGYRWGKQRKTALLQKESQTR
jgi:AraC family transcriptional regulator of adaptative response/methylated-DNA-[protein]-cysteine methyltransferase